MDTPRNGVRGSSFKYGPAVRIGIAVLVLHTVGWLAAVFFECLHKNTFEMRLKG